MNIRKRVLSFLLVACMLFGLLPVSAQAVTAEQPPIAAATSPREADTRITTAYSDEEVPAEVLAELLGEDQPLDTGNVTAEKVENPGVELKRNPEQLQDVEVSMYDVDEHVRVIVVLEDRGLLAQGFTTAQIAANGAQVERQVETLAQRQESVLQSINRMVDAPVEARYRYNVAVSGLAVEIPYGALEEVRSLPGVKDAFVAPQYDVPEDMTGDTTEPDMYATKESFGSALTWETLGYTGQGMRIAIIDTGLDLDHPSFAAVPQLTGDSLTREELTGLIESLNAYTLYGTHHTEKLTAEDLYRSEKVPYAFNYVDENLDATHDNDTAGPHGTHVAGIAAANKTEGTDVVGVAPDAQLLVLKVFGSNGGAYFDDILAALEDCYRLNADVVNMSLGTAAGFTDGGEATNEIFGQILDSDMIAAIAAGNDSSAALMNGYGTNRNLTKDPDNGVAGSPASYIGGTMVASQENTHVKRNYFTVDGENIAFNDVSAHPFIELAGEALTYVMVPGYGAEEDFAGLDLAGKVAVISRGQINFTVKQENAYNAGAIACVIYDNVDGPMSNMMDSRLLPNVFVTKASGELLAAKAVDGMGTLTVGAADDMIPADNPQVGQMSDFSSWGVTPDLQLAPDVTAPGGNIYSTLDDGTYGNMSGTSMATPHIAGMSALVLEYLREKYDLTDAQTHTVAEALIMSTAEPIVEPSGVLYSPRKQGAGSANVYKAITSPAYLTVDSGQELTPKVSLGDDDARTGVYRFSFDVNNLTDKPLTYLLDGSVLTDQVDLTYAAYGYYFMGETSRNLDASVAFSLKDGALPVQYDYNADGTTDMADVQALLDAVNGLSEVKSGYDLNADGKTDTADTQALYELVSAGFTPLDVVEVPADGKATVYVTVTLTGDDKAYMDTYYENGIYVDGFVRLLARDGNTVDLSLPFVGFYGDWSAARVFDSGWIYEEEPEFNRYVNALLSYVGNSVAYVGGNPYLNEEYDPYHNVISSNGDGYMDRVSDIYLSMMRGAKKVDFTWSNVDTGETLFNATAGNVRKSVYKAAYGICVPMVASGEFRQYRFTDENGKGLPDGTDLMLTVQAYLDDGNNAVDETITVPVHIDNEAPVLYTDEIAYLYNPYTDTRRLEFFVSDNYGVAAVVALTKAGTPVDYLSVEDVPGEKLLVSLDVTDYDSDLVIAVCDYGCNENYYEISFSGKNNVDFDSFYGFRCFSSLIQNGVVTAVTYGLNGWYSFRSADRMLQRTSQVNDGETTVYAAEYLDGYVVGVDENGTIFAARAGDWSRTELGKLELDGVAYTALDMAFDYTTNTLFLLTDELEVGAGGHLMKVDYRTGAVTDVGAVTGIDSETAQGITLACDNEGVLYTID